MVFETDTIPVLVRDLARVVQTRVLVDHSRRRFQYIYEEHPEKEAQEQRQQL